MTKSDEIRKLASSGLSIADIARQLGIRYQHAYNVLKASRAPDSLAVGAKGVAAMNQKSTRPALTTQALIEAGFDLSARWVKTPVGELEMDARLPSKVGVYAFAKDGIVLYVGVATMGLSKRIYFYKRPGTTQRTSQRLNVLLKEMVSPTTSVEIYTACPNDLEWNGLPVHGSAGLELGLIRKYELPWNLRSSH